MQDLIDTLCSEHKPVKRPLPPLLRALILTLISCAYVAAMVLLVGLRPDIGLKLKEHEFLFEIIVMGAMAITAGISFFLLCIPDVAKKKWVISVPLTLLGVYAVWCGIHCMHEGMDFQPIHWTHCLTESLFMAGIPALVLAIFVYSRHATTHPRLMALMGVLTIAGYAYIGMRFTCMVDTAMHAISYHILPFIIAGLVLGMLARRLLRW
jgi:hypothetical protein